MRLICLMLMAGMLLASLGSGCFVAFFIFDCESDFDCSVNEFCDVDGSCVSVFFLNETDTCLVEHDCDDDFIPPDQI